MRITIGGKCASGKSTVAKLIAQKLHLKHYSVGDLMRELAASKGMSILELNKLAETDKDIDQELDARQKKLNKEDDFIIDSRLGFFFIKNAIKIFLEVDDNEAARRIFIAPPRNSEKTYNTKKDALCALIARRESETKRIKKTYGIDVYDNKNYDLVIDTTDKKPEVVCKDIIQFFKNKRKVL